MLTPVIIGFLSAIPVIYGVDWFVSGRPYVPKFLKRFLKSKTPNLVNQVQESARRLKQIEENGQRALKAIQNLHDTKKRINNAYTEVWEKEFLLLLPPPEPVKGRKPLKMKTKDYAVAHPDPFDRKKEDEIHITPDMELVPVAGVWDSKNNCFWVAFNNIPGHHDRVYFTTQYVFEDPGIKYKMLIPEAYKVNGEWTWETNKAKIITRNLKDTLVDTVNGLDIEIRIG